MEIKKRKGRFIAFVNKWNKVFAKRNKGKEHFDSMHCMYSVKTGKWGKVCPPSEWRITIHKGENHVFEKYKIETWEEAILLRDFLDALIKEFNPGA